MFKIGISCIGGGVGQSVINACRLSRLPIKTIGLDTNPFAYGAYDCDVFDYSSSVTGKNYVADLIDKCREHAIDLIIPGLDDEILIIAQNKDKFKEAGVIPLVSDPELIRLCRDKERMSLELNRIANVFVTSYSRDTLLNGTTATKVNFPLIAKPRGGSASKGVEIIQNKSDLNKIKETHIIQELALPSKDDPNHEHYLKQIHKNKNPQVSEISVQIVTDKHGRLLGKMASYNKLKDGIPIEIVPVDDNRIWKVIDKLIPHFLELGLRGPLNIQGRLTEKGLKIFEMNPRFTGITGIRALMGFNEVESCLISWLDIDRQDISLSLNDTRFGVRQTADKVLPLERNEKVKSLSRQINSTTGKTAKTLLVTGATGYLGRHFIQDIRGESEFTIWAYDQSREKLVSLFPQKEIRFFDKTDYTSGKLSMGNIDVLLHCGLAGSSRNRKDIANNLAFTNELFTLATMHQVPAIIYISSKSVYGSDRNTSWNEAAPAAPATPHAQAKYAAELMLQNLHKMNNQIRFTSLRLAALSGGNHGPEPDGKLAQLVQKELCRDKTDLAYNAQVQEWLDIRDAVRAINSILNTPTEQWKPVYNVGSGITCSIREVAEIVIERVTRLSNGTISDKVTGNPYSIITRDMGNSLFRNDTGWEPLYGLDDTIDSLCRYFQSQEKVSP